MVLPYLLSSQKAIGNVDIAERKLQMLKRSLFGSMDVTIAGQVTSFSIDLTPKELMCLNLPMQLVGMYMDSLL